MLVVMLALVAIETLAVIAVAVLVYRAARSMTQYVAYATHPLMEMPPPPTITPIQTMTTEQEAPLTEPRAFYGVPLAASMETDKHRRWRDGEEPSENG